jgi:hypothetical protein
VGDALSFVLFVAVLVALVWFGWRYEPHWSSKDGTRFTARTRPLLIDNHAPRHAPGGPDARGTLVAAFAGAGGGSSNASAFALRWRDARVFVDDDLVQVITRVGPLRRPLPPVRVIARGESTNGRRAVYLIDGDPMREIRVPMSSRAVPVMDALVARSSGNAVG